MPSTCSAEGCERPVTSKGLCRNHYQRNYRNRLATSAEAGACVRIAYWYGLTKDEARAKYNALPAQAQRVLLHHLGGAGTRQPGYCDVCKTKRGHEYRNPAKPAEPHTWLCNACHKLLQQFGIA